MPAPPTSPATPRDPSREDPSDDLPRIGEIIAGKYRVERLLGKGGAGLVVEATHVQLREPMAIKLLRPEAARRPIQVARFLREAQAAVRIKSQHVARVTDVGTLPNGAPFMVMELLRGTDLQQLCRERGPLPVHEAVEYVIQACEGVEAAHALGIIHRDLKPGNLFLTDHPGGAPLVKVVDFGISKTIESEGTQKEDTLTAADGLLGSPLYMSPEQIRFAGGVDARADVWSLGAVLYRLLAGHPAFDADSTATVLMRIINDEPTPLGDTIPSLPPELEATLLHCLEKDHKRRIQSAAELAQKLAPFRHARAPRDQPRSSALVMNAAPTSTPAPASAPSTAPALASAPSTAPALASAPAPLPVPVSAPAPPSRVAPFVLGAIGLVVVFLLGSLLAALLFGRPAAQPPASGLAPPSSAPPSSGDLPRAVASRPVESGPSASPAQSAPPPPPIAVESANPLPRPAPPPSSLAPPRGKPRVDPLGDRL